MLKTGMIVKLKEDTYTAWNNITIKAGSIVKVNRDNSGQVMLEVTEGEVEKKVYEYNSTTGVGRYITKEVKVPTTAPAGGLVLDKVDFETIGYFCPSCGKELPKEELLEDKVTFACKECAEANSKTCDICGETRLLPRLGGSLYREIDGKLLCPTCAYTETFYCPSCHTYHLSKNGYKDERGVMWCTKECKDEYRVDGNDCIWDYGEKLDPVFFGKGLTLGVELEVDGNVDYEDRDNLAYALSEISGLHYCKDDGSLDNGVEIVTMPCSLEYHKEKFPWRDIIHTALDYGFLSDKAGTCGLHVHVDRSYFDTGFYNSGDAAVALMYLFDKYREKFVKFSRRFESQLSWGKIREVDIKNIPDSYDDLSRDRYMAINVTNSHTLEFRLWKGTLNYKTFIATLEMTQNLCDIVKNTLAEEGVEGIEKITWADICNYSDYEEMVVYLKKRDIYEAVEAEIA